VAEYLESGRFASRAEAMEALMRTGDENFRRISSTIIETDVAIKSQLEELAGSSPITRAHKEELLSTKTGMFLENCGLSLLLSDCVADDFVSTNSYQAFYSKLRTKDTMNTIDNKLVNQYNVPQNVVDAIDEVKVLHNQLKTTSLSPENYQEKLIQLRGKMLILWNEISNLKPGDVSYKTTQLSTPVIDMIERFDHQLSRTTDSLIEVISHQNPLLDKLKGGKKLSDFTEEELDRILRFIQHSSDSIEAVNNHNVRRLSTQIFGDSRNCSTEFGRAKFTCNNIFCTRVHFVGYLNSISQV